MSFKVHAATNIKLPEGGDNRLRNVVIRFNFNNVDLKTTSVYLLYFLNQLKLNICAKFPGRLSTNKCCVFDVIRQSNIV